MSAPSITLPPLLTALTSCCHVVTTVAAPTQNGAAEKTPQTIIRDNSTLTLFFSIFIFLPPKQTQRSSGMHIYRNCVS